MKVSLERIAWLLAARTLLPERLLCFEHRRTFFDFAVKIYSFDLSFLNTAAPENPGADHEDSLK